MTPAAKAAQHIRRWGCDKLGPAGSMRVLLDGNYVLYSDYAALQARCEVIEKAGTNCVQYMRMALESGDVMDGYNWSDYQDALKKLEAALTPATGEKK